jgi:beta-lactamase regulating signal transducer with metallopeptidase domain
LYVWVFRELFDGASAMWVWIDRASPILFDAALSTAIFLSAIVLAMLICRQPSRRLQIARAALLASLAMLPLVALAPLPRLDLVNSFIEPSLLPPSMTAGSDSLERPAPGAFLSGLLATWHIPGDLQEYVWIAWRWLPRSLALVDLACVAVGCAWLLLGFWGVRWLLRHSQVPSPATSALFERLTGGAAHGHVVLRVSPRVRRPVVVGMLRPTILIPPSYDEPESVTELLRLGLLHEIAHAEQADSWFGTVASLAQTVWFFLPHVWWIRSQLLIDQEFLADRAAALRYGTPADYAASLLSLAESAPSSPAETRPPARGEFWPDFGNLDGRSPLFQRMLMLLYCPFRVDVRVSRVWAWTGRLTVVAAAILAACVCIRWPYPAGARTHGQADGAAPTDQSFRVADFVAEPMVFLPGGRALPYIMPVALPTHFDLTVEVLASMTDLANVHIAGHPLGGGQRSPAIPEASWGSFAHTDSWHQIRLVRQGFQLSLWVDGQKMPGPINPQATSEWLTFEPSPDRAAHFRNLIVNW